MGKLKDFLDTFGKKQVPLSSTMGGFGQSIVTRQDTLAFYSSWIWGCIDKRSKAFAKVNFKLYRLKNNGDLEQVISHPLLELLYKLNPQMTKFDFFELSMTYLDLFGASPWYLDKGLTGNKVQAIYLLRPEFLTAELDNTGAIVRYKYQLGSFSAIYQPEDVIMLKNYNPSDPTKGLGTIEAVRDNAEQDDYMRQSNTNLMKNDTRLSGVIEVPGTPKQEAIDRIEKQWGQRFGGFNNSGKTKILTDNMKYVPLGLSPKDMDYVASQNFNRDEILAIFGVPKEIFGNLSTANRASAEAVEFIFSKWTIEPIVQKYTEQLNEFLVPLFGSDLWLKFDDLTREDEEKLLNKVNLLTDKVLTRNESRELYGYGPMKGGDELWNSFSNIAISSNSDNAKRLGMSNSEIMYIKSRIWNRDYQFKQAMKRVDNILEKGIKLELKKIELEKKNDNTILKFVEPKKKTKLNKK